MKTHRFVKDWSYTVDAIMSHRYTKGSVHSLPADILAKAIKDKAVEPTDKVAEQPIVPPVAEDKKPSKSEKPAV